MAKKSYKAYFSFIGGLNVSAAPDNLRNDEAREIVNFDLVSRGAMINRPGTTAMDWGFPEEAPIDYIAELPKSDGRRFFLIVTGRELWAKEDDNDPFYLKDIGVASPLEARHFSYTIYQDKMYFLCDGEYYWWDGGQALWVAGGPEFEDNMVDEVRNCKYIISKGERIYMAGSPTNPTALYYSQVGEPVYFKTGDFRIFINSGDGDAITGLCEYQDAVLIFKAHGIWKYTGVSPSLDSQLVRLSADTGTKAHRTIKNIRNFVAYLGSDNCVYIIKTLQTGVVVTEKISGQIDPLLKDVQCVDGWWFGNSPCAGVYDGKYILAYSDDKDNPTSNNRVCVCHIGVGLDAKVTPWTVYDGLSISSMFKATDGQFYMGDSTKGEIFIFDKDQKSDRGTAITYKLVSKDYDLDSPIHIKKVTRGWLVFRQYVDFLTNIDLSVIVDYIKRVFNNKDAAESLVWGKGNFGETRWGWIDTSTVPVKIGRKGLRVRIEFTATSDDTYENELFLYGFAFEYKTKKPIK